MSVGVLCFQRCYCLTLLTAAVCVVSGDALYRQAGKVSGGLRSFGRWLWSRAGGATVGPIPPTPAEGAPETSTTNEADLRAALERLVDRKDVWVETPTEKRAELVSQCLAQLPDSAKGAASNAVRFYGSYGQGIGGEMSSWAPVALGLMEFEEAMRSGGQPKLPGVSQRWNNSTGESQYVVDAFPSGPLALLFAGVVGEVWITPGEGPTQGAVYKRKKEGKGKSSVAVVLGAGNQVSIVVLDVLHMLLVEDHVVILKMSPVNHFLGPHICDVLAPFIDEGFLEVVYGDGQTGSFLCQHPVTKTIHLTGSATTFNRIVWGESQPGLNKTFKQDGNRVLPEDKMVTGELGNVTPFILVPGEWTDAELEYHAKSILAGLTFNAAHTCCTPEILITSRNWPQRGKFLQALRRALRSSSRRVAYYPYSDEKYENFRNRFVQSGHTVEEYGQDSDAGGLPPWMLVTGLNPSEADTITENWCGVLQEVCLDVGGRDVEGFLDHAVDFANDCWGCLTCSVFIDPTTQRTSSQAFEKALEKLRFGSIVVNAPAMLSFSTTRLSWGAYPGNSIADIGSGNCAVHNTLLLDHPQKSILYWPWQYHPFPIWFTSITNTAKILEAYFQFFVQRSVSSMLKMLPAELVARADL